MSGPFRTRSFRQVQHLCAGHRLRVVPGRPGLWDPGGELTGRHGEFVFGIPAVISTVYWGDMMTSTVMSIIMSCSLSFFSRTATCENEETEEWLWWSTSGQLLKKKNRKQQWNA